MDAGEQNRRQVRGHRVPLRTEPRVGSPLVDRLDTGQSVTVLEPRAEWLKIRVDRTRREGWVPTKRIAAEPDDAETKQKPRVAPVLAAAAIAKLLIAASIADYPGPCTCPYQSARNGSTCGRRAAYSRPGGYAPLCFDRDVTPAMIAEYRRTH